jgi:hypothetical protein
MLLAFITAKRRFVFLSRYGCDEDFRFLLEATDLLDLVPFAFGWGELNA